MSQSDVELEVLSAPECRSLLEQHHFGRLAYLDSVGVMPMIIPVNYLLHADQVVFRTDPGSKLTAAVRGTPVAFQIDGIDEQRRVGWSVLVRGHLEEVTEPGELERLRRSPLVPWAPGDKSHYLRVLPGKISGRRISVAHLPSNWLG